MTLTLYHNPRCSKSREALALLESRGLAPKVVRYLENPPTVGELRKLLKLLGLSPRDLLRTKEPEYAGLGLDNPKHSGVAILAAIAAHPELLERPILISGRRAVIARPPARVLEIV